MVHYNGGTMVIVTRFRFNLRKIITMPLYPTTKLPFPLELEPALKWLDTLSTTSVRDSSQALFPVLQTINTQNMEPLLRFHILERCHPLVLTIVRELLPYYLGKSFPLLQKNRKLAYLAFRFHLELSQGYCQLVKTHSLEKSLRILALSRALEHLGQSLLRSAEVYELPHHTFFTTLALLHQYTDEHKWFQTHSTESDDAIRPSIITARYQLIHLIVFMLAAPWRLHQRDIQGLFDRLIAPVVSKCLETDTARKIAVFYYDPVEILCLVPGWPDVPPLPHLPCFLPKEFFPVLRVEVEASKDREKGLLARSLFRLGERLLCNEQSSGRRITLHIRFTAIESLVRDATHQPSTSDLLSSSAAWTTAKNSLELSPLGNSSLSNEPFNPFQKKRTLADAVANAAIEASNRSVTIVPTECPGFYLIDSGRWPLRTGWLAALSDEQSLQLGVIRAGQFRDGRFWHSWELLGLRWHLVQISHTKIDRSSQKIPQSGIVVFGESGEASIILAPGKWRQDEPIILRWKTKSQLSYLARVLEVTHDFYQFSLFTPDETTS